VLAWMEVDQFPRLPNSEDDKLKNGFGLLVMLLLLLLL